MSRAAQAALRELNGLMPAGDGEPVLALGRYSDRDGMQFNLVGKKLNNVDDKTYNVIFKMEENNQPQFRPLAASTPYNKAAFDWDGQPAEGAEATDQTGLPADAREPPQVEIDTDPSDMAFRTEKPLFEMNKLERRKTNIISAQPPRVVDMSDEDVDDSTKALKTSEPLSELSKKGMGVGTRQQDTDSVRGSRRGSRRGSSRRGRRRSSRGGSKRGSKRASRRGSRRGSKRRSRKGSKRGSKRDSKRGSSRSRRSSSRRNRRKSAAKVAALPAPSQPLAIEAAKPVPKPRRSLQTDKRADGDTGSKSFRRSVNASNRSKSWRRSKSSKPRSRSTTTDSTPMTQQMEQGSTDVFEDAKGTGTKALARLQTAIKKGRVATRRQAKKRAGGQKRGKQLPANIRQLLVIPRRLVERYTRLVMGRGGRMKRLGKTAIVDLVILAEIYTTTVVQVASDATAAIDKKGTKRMQPQQVYDGMNGVPELTLLFHQIFGVRLNNHVQRARDPIVTD